MHPQRKRNMEMNNNEATLLKWAEQINFDDSDIESVTTIYHQIIIVNRKLKSRKKIKKTEEDKHNTW